MAEAKNKLVKLVTTYKVHEQRATLWGVDFVSKDDVYHAEVTAEQAKSLIDAGRATLSK